MRVFDLNWNIVEGEWKQFKCKVQEAYGITKDAADQQIRHVEDSNN